MLEDEILTYLEQTLLDTEYRRGEHDGYYEIPEEVLKYLLSIIKEYKHCVDMNINIRSEENRILWSQEENVFYLNYDDISHLTIEDIIYYCLKKNMIIEISGTNLLFRKKV